MKVALIEFHFYEERRVRLKLPKLEKSKAHIARDHHLNPSSISLDLRTGLAFGVNLADLLEDDDEEYDDVVQVEEGKDGEDLEHVAAEGRFQPIHLMGGGGVGFNRYTSVYMRILNRNREKSLKRSYNQRKLKVTHGCRTNISVENGRDEF